VRLADLRNLEELNLSDCSINNDALRQLAGHRSLKRLLMRGAIITDPLHELKRLTGLRRLDISDCSLEFPKESDVSLAAWIGGLESLEELYLKNWPLHADDVEAVSRLANLRVLDCSACDLSSKGVKLLTTLPQLEQLGLAERVLNDDTIEMLKKMPCLKVLSIQREPRVVALTSDQLEEFAKEKVAGIGRLNVLARAADP